MAAYSSNPGRTAPAVPGDFLSLDFLLEIIDEHNLSRLEIRALFKILSRMAPGNQMDVSQSEIMRAIGSSPTNSSKVFKKLRDAKIIVESNGRAFVNPHIAAKGNSRGREKA